MPNEVCVVVSTEGLNALVDTALAPTHQSVLDELVARNAEGKLTAEELQQLDFLLKRTDELNLVKANAAAALHQINSKG